MTKSIIDYGLRTLLIMAWVTASCLAEDPRETPQVVAVKRAKSAVVNLHTEKTNYGTKSYYPRKVSGMGTGIIIDERGYIVTNYHVVHGVDSLRVTLDDGGSFLGRVISYDRQADLAILKIDPQKSLKTIPLGISADLMLAERVIAVGNAFGYEHTVTQGIVSSLSRDVEVNDKQSYHNLIQTDASINPGNSGGPLINIKGEVVGINVAIRSGAQRIGFAIPIDQARKTIAQLLNIEQLNHTYHGIVAQDIKTPEEQKLVVSSFRPNSPAKKAGLKTGDTILKVGKLKVLDGVDLERALLERSVGDQIEMVVLRDDQEQKISLTLGDFQQIAHHSSQSRKNVSMVSGVQKKNQVTVRGNTPEDDLSWLKLGVKLRSVGDDDQSLAGFKYRGGMKVNQVRPNSPAAKSGIRSGDILVGLHIWETINQKNIEYVLKHPQLTTFNPLKFYIVRKRETYQNHLQLN